MKIVLTGATGFVGSSVLNHLIDLKHSPVVVARAPGKMKPCIEQIFVDSIDSNTIWDNTLVGCEVVIHCAARAHIMKDESVDPLDDYREVNTRGTINFAKQAAKAGVKRFIFISSIKVNGEATSNDKPFTACDKRAPRDPYGVSKSEAELQLLELAEQGEMEVVIIRPPLVYGPGVKANFASLLRLISKGFPLPFACIRSNKRSMVSLDNLVDLIATCIDHPKAANQVFLVSDDEDLSTSAMIKNLAKACGKNGFMLPIPVSIFHLVGRILGKADVIDRLTGSLHVDITKTKEILDWAPSASIEEGFNKTAVAFLQTRDKK